MLETGLEAAGVSGAKHSMSAKPGVKVGPTPVGRAGPAGLAVALSCTIAAAAAAGGASVAAQPVWSYCPVPHLHGLKGGIVGDEPPAIICKGSSSHPILRVSDSINVQKLNVEDANVGMLLADAQLLCCLMAQDGSTILCDQVTSAEVLFGEQSLAGIYRVNRGS